MSTASAERPAPDDQGMALLTPEFLDDPYPEYAAMRAISPVVWLDALNMWFVTGYDAVRDGFRDDRLAVAYENLQVGLQGPEVVNEPYFEFFANSMVAHDAPRHTLIRSVFRQAISRTEVTQLGDRIDGFCARFLDEIEARASELGSNEADVVDQYSNRVPHAMISSILGVPEEDRPKLKTFALDLAGVAEAQPMGAEQVARVNAACAGLHEFFAELMERKAAEPGNDFISHAVAANAEAPVEGQLTHEEMTCNFATLYTGGQDTQEKLFANILLALHRNPEAMQRLADDPELVDECWDELIRYDTAGQFMGRVAAVDLELAGVTVPKGDLVVLSWAAANRDPKYFDAPDELRLDRATGDGPGPLTFGIGRHFCVGSHLAQANLPRMLKHLLRRFGPVTVDLEHSQRNPSIATRGFTATRITWD